MNIPSQLSNVKPEGKILRRIEELARGSRKSERKV